MGREETRAFAQRLMEEVWEPFDSSAMPRSVAPGRDRPPPASRWFHAADRLRGHRQSSGLGQTDQRRCRLRRPGRHSRRRQVRHTVRLHGELRPPSTLEDRVILRDAIAHEHYLAVVAGESRVRRRCQEGQGEPQRRRGEQNTPTTTAILFLRSLSTPRSASDMFSPSSPGRGSGLLGSLRWGENSAPSAKDPFCATRVSMSAAGEQYIGQVALFRWGQVAHLGRVRWLVISPMEGAGFLRSCRVSGQLSYGALLALRLASFLAGATRYPCCG